MIRATWRALKAPAIRQTVVLSALLASTAVLAQAASAAAPGTLNTAFGPGGSRTLPAGTQLFGTAVQSNGDVVAVGESGVGTAAQLMVVRFTRAGALDGSFGSGGVVNGPAITGATGSLGRAVAIQRDGKIVVVGTASDATGSGRKGLLIERFNTNGSVDTGFGSGGIVNLLGTMFGDGYAVALQPNGAIVAAGAASPAAVPQVAVARLSANGAPDSSFGAGGVHLFPFGGYATAQAVAVQPNGAIVLAGSQSPGLQSVSALIARVTPSGALDPSFAGTGATTFDNAFGGGFASFNALALQSNGAIVAIGNATGGSSNAFTLLIRYTATGAKDASFGTGGVAVAPSAANWTSHGSGTPGGDAGALAANGDIIAAGQAANGAVGSAAIWAFTSSGHLDTRFGSGGAAVFQNSSGLNTEFAGLGISPVDGNLFAVGDALSVFNGYTGLAASYVGFPSAPPPPPPLKLTVSNVKANYKAATLTFSAACNQACSLSAKLLASAATAKQLKIGTTKTVCKKVHGKRKCKKVTTYKPFTAASATGSLRAAGTKVFTLRLSRKVANALHKQKSVSFSLVVTAKSATRKTSTSTTKVTFRR